MLGHIKSSPKFKGLEEEQKVNQSLANKHFVPNGHWGHAVQFIIYEAKNGIFEDLCLALS